MVPLEARHNHILEAIYTAVCVDGIKMPLPINSAAQMLKASKGGSGSASAAADAGPPPGANPVLFHREVSRAVRNALALLQSHVRVCRLYYSKMNTELVRIMMEECIKYVDEYLYNIQCSEIFTLINEKLHTEA
jgi:hypothetical protein